MTEEATMRHDESIDCMRGKLEEVRVKYPTGRAFVREVRRRTRCMKNWEKLDSWAWVLWDENLPGLSREADRRRDQFRKKRGV